jgi:hypothetical protein
MGTTNTYPFKSKKEIVAELATSAEACKQAIVVLYNRQTQHEQDTASTLSRNKAGFMSSHAVHGTRIAKAILAGEDLSEEDTARCQAIAPRYSKQLAAEARKAALEANPDLAAAGAVFGV